MAQNKEVEIVSVNEDNTIDVVSPEGEEANLLIVKPALDFIDRVKQGKATIGMDIQGNVNYVRMANFTPNQNKSFNKPFKKQFNQARTPPQSFSPANKYNKDPIYYESQVKKLEGVTLLEFQETYNQLSKNVWITASQVFPTPQVKMEEVKDKSSITHILYDAIIYIKVKREGVRVVPQEEIPDEEY